MRVDFHVHSTASDGSVAPSEIAAMSRDFAAIALTDHDNCDGVVEFLSFKSGDDAASPGDAASPVRVAGVELSVEPGEGFDKFHLLGLGIDPKNAALKEFLRRVLEGRNARNERILANFRRLGIEMEGIADYTHGEVLARPHFAKWLVEHGIASDIRAAFDAYLKPDSPMETRCYEERWHPPQEESFRVIHGAGGICVMAHPKYWRRDWAAAGADYVAAERELAALKEKGLDGLESLYQANSAAENVGFTLVADRLGLLKSAGSDYHGSHKPDISLGMEVSDRFISPLLDRLICSR